MLRYIDSVVDSNDNERLTVEGRDLYQEIQRQDEADLQETLNTPMPSTQDVQYPQDSAPAASFGDGVEPTQLPMMKQKYMQSPEGGITRLPGGESGPSQGPYTPVRNDGSGYMPDGREPGVPAPMPMRADLPGKFGTEVAQTAGLVDGLRDLGLGARDKILDIADRPFHEELFIKAHTGGVGGDGVLRELPDNILRTIKKETQKDTKRRNYDSDIDLEKLAASAKDLIANPEKATNPFEVQGAENFLANYEREVAKAADPGRSTSGDLDLYTSGNREAHLGLGTIGVYFDKQGGVLIKDKWKVDGSEQGRPTMKDGTKGLYADLAEGGFPASNAHDLAKQLGTYRDIPIEVRLTKEQWDAIQAD